ncbi:hypothetical protein [Nesterenkonia pannonica]|uniref:hypothetical protein n=1 Tax=Nesterenkonia pannonica TaxID=1548602 RepID=UPI002164E423|nr:hypothetical protein [Nesterenkonia pannonica]
MLANQCQDTIAAHIADPSGQMLGALAAEGPCGQGRAHRMPLRQPSEHILRRLLEDGDAHPRRVP